MESDQTKRRREQKRDDSLHQATGYREPRLTRPVRHTMDETNAKQIIEDLERRVGPITPKTDTKPVKKTPSDPPTSS